MTNLRKKKRVRRWLTGAGFLFASLASIAYAIHEHGANLNAARAAQTTQTMQVETDTSATQVLEPLPLAPPKTISTAPKPVAYAKADEAAAQRWREKVAAEKAAKEQEAAVQRWREKVAAEKALASATPANKKTKQSTYPPGKTVRQYKVTDKNDKGYTPPPAPGAYRYGKGIDVTQTTDLEKQVRAEIEGKQWEQMKADAMTGLKQHKKESDLEQIKAEAEKLKKGEVKPAKKVHLPFALWPFNS